MSELKNCPFCGYKPEMEWVAHNSVKPDSVLVYCCVVSMDEPSEEAAIKAWNTRHNEPPEEDIEMIANAARQVMDDEDL